MSEALDALRQVLLAHERVRRNRQRQDRRQLNIAARDAVGRPLQHGRAETMILVDGEPRSPSELL